MRSAFGNKIASIREVAPHKVSIDPALMTYVSFPRIDPVSLVYALFISLCTYKHIEQIVEINQNNKLSNNLHNGVQGLLLSSTDHCCQGLQD